MCINRQVKYLLTCFFSHVSKRSSPLFFVVRSNEINGLVVCNLLIPTYIYMIMYKDRHTYYVPRYHLRYIDSNSFAAHSLRILILLCISSSQLSILPNFLLFSRYYREVDIPTSHLLPFFLLLMYFFFFFSSRSTFYHVLSFSTKY